MFVSMQTWRPCDETLRQTLINNRVVSLNLPEGEANPPLQWSMIMQRMLNEF